MAVPAIRLLIVDDDEQFLDALEAMLEPVEDIDVVGRAGNGRDATQHTRELMPDALTMDIDMPVMDGVEATRTITATFRVPIVMLTSSDSSERVDEALAAGASAYISKSRTWDELVPAIRAALSRSPRS